MPATNIEPATPPNHADALSTGTMVVWRIRVTSQDAFSFNLNFEEESDSSEVFLMIF